jgi:hypothetical protein
VESEALIREGKRPPNLVNSLVDCSTTNPEVSEAAIGFKEKLLLGWIDERGLILTQKCYGTWCGRPRALDYQDILVYKKPAA